MGKPQPRVLLARFLQQQKPNTNKKPQQSKQMMTLHQVLAALHKNADKNHDGRISDHEILDIFQGVRNHLSASDFGSFLDLVNHIKGPVNCGAFKDCGKCTAAKNAGLCGWFKSSSHSVFGGYTSKGNCKFVDRENSAEQRDTSAAKATTCANQCNARNRPGGNKGGRGSGSGRGNKGGRGSGRGGNQFRGPRE